MKEQNRQTTCNTKDHGYLRILPALEHLEDSYHYDIALTRAENNKRLLSKLRAFLDLLSCVRPMDERQRLLLEYFNYPPDHKFNPTHNETMLHFLVLRALNLGKDMILEEVFG